MTAEVEPEPAETYAHFGPGVPAAPGPAGDRATAVWRGEVEPAPGGSRPGREDDPALAARRRNQRWILPLTVLILVVAMAIYYLWNRAGQSLSVRGVSVTPGATPLGCGGTERLSGVVHTDGDAGTLAYEWLRSDGTVSGPLTQPVSRGTQQLTLVLAWDFKGFGTYDATARLRVLSPGSATASASFTYRCARP
jgi:hypothetical protein